jgi:hypothetical protein
LGLVVFQSPHSSTEDSRAQLEEENVRIQARRRRRRRIKRRSDETRRSNV